jgi:hypothetical protein
LRDRGDGGAIVEQDGGGAGERIDHGSAPTVVYASERCGPHVDGLEPVDPLAGGLGRRVDPDRMGEREVPAAVPEQSLADALPRQGVGAGEQLDPPDPRGGGVEVLDVDVRVADRQRLGRGHDARVRPAAVESLRARSVTRRRSSCALRVACRWSIWTRFTSVLAVGWSASNIAAMRSSG